MESRPDVIYIRDRGEPLPLYPKLINGVKVYTPSEEKTAELKQRYDELCVTVPSQPLAPRFFKALFEVLLEIGAVVLLGSIFVYLFLF